SVLGAIMCHTTAVGRRSCDVGPSAGAGRRGCAADVGGADDPDRGGEGLVVLALEERSRHALVAAVGMGRVGGAVRIVRRVTDGVDRKSVVEGRDDGADGGRSVRLVGW